MAGDNRCVPPSDSPPSQSLTAYASLYDLHPTRARPHALLTVGVFGLCIHAETALQAHELEQRLRENTIRREARLDLSRRGLVPTETAIAKWRDERERAEAAAAATEQTHSPPPQPSQTS